MSASYTSTQSHIRDVSATANSSVVSCTASPRTACRLTTVPSIGAITRSRLDVSLVATTCSSSSLGKPQVPERLG